MTFVYKKIILILIIFVSIFSISLLSGQDRVSSSLKTIQTIEKSGNYREALNRLQNLYQKHPKNGAVFSYYKNLCLRTGQYDKAEELIKNRLKLFPDDAALKTALASVMYKKGNHQNAFDICNEIIDKAGGNVYIYQIVSGAMIRERLNQRALEVLKKGKENTNKSEILSLNILDLYIAQLDFSNAGKEMAILVFSNHTYLPFVKSRIDRMPAVLSALNPVIKQVRKIAKKQPCSVVLKKMLIDLYIKAGFFDRAVKAEWEIEKKEGHGRGIRLFNLSRTLFYKEEYSKALSLLQEIEKKFPDSPDAAQFVLFEARCLEEQKHFNKAAEKYRDISKRFPGSADAAASLFRLGKILLGNLKMPEHAKESFTEFINKFPHSKDFYPALYWLGKSELMLGNFKNAVELFESLRKKSTKNDELWVKSTSLLGRTFYFKGDMKKSIKILKELVSDNISFSGLEDPELNDGLELYLFLSEQLKKYQRQTTILARAEFYLFSAQQNRALSSIDSLINNWPDNPVTGYSMILKSKIYFKQGKIRSAVKTLKFVRNKFKKSTFDEKAAEKIGFYLEESGDSKGAIEQYEEFLETFPESLMAGEIRQRLRELKRSF